ncbi:hypothetical protein [Oligoflexus tunisiensis]|uniref:hypothetical protein n=1 Tax=Oligoflexus tunisiensis TaxID=708132 RepID=UPI00114CDFDD|nr:hypothetical protein [Oligoflexus tunisiensis]
MLKGLGKLQVNIVLLVAAAALWVTLAFMHFNQIRLHAVNIPASDEWEILNNDANLTLKDPAWIFSQQNEHRIVPTKLINVIFAYATDWNLALQIMFNFFIYLGLVLYLTFLLAKLVPDQRWIPVLSSIFLLTTLPWEDHFWAFQSCFHFLILASLWCCHLFLYKTAGPTQVWSRILAALTCIYALYAGILVSLTLLGLMGVRLFYDHRVKKHKGTTKSFAAFALLTASIAVACWAYFQFGYVKRQTSLDQLALPYQWTYWEYFFNLVGLGFGAIQINWKVGFVLFVLSYAPVLILLWQRRKNLRKEDWLLLGLYGAVTVILASIAVGRGAAFGVSQSKSSRYAEFASLLIPLMLTSWYVVLQKQKHVAAGAFALLCLLTAYSVRHSWNFQEVYKDAWTFRNAGRDCVFQYYSNQGDGTCSTIFPWGSIKDRLEFARSLKVSFYKEWEARAARTSAQ